MTLIWFAVLHKVQGLSQGIGIDNSKVLLAYYATSVLANILGRDQSGCSAPHSAIPCSLGNML